MRQSVLAIMTVLFSPTVFVSCEKEDERVNPGSRYLTVRPVIESRSETRSAGAVNAFKAGDRIGLYITGASGTLNNVPAGFNGSEWILKEIEGAEAVQAYFPYSAGYDENIEAVPVDINAQEDFLYSVNTTVYNNVAQLSMKHAMSLVSVIVMKNDYNHEGRVSRLEIDGIPAAGQVNLRNGVTRVTGEAVTYRRALSYTLDDYNPEKISTIVLPIALSDMQEVTLSVRVDDVDYSFRVPAAHVWEGGMEYTYTLNIHETFKPDVMEVIPVDVSYWNTYGKTDRITIPDRPNQNLWFHRGATFGGKITVKGEGQIFGGAITNNSATDWEGQWRYGMFDMWGNLVELYQAYNITVPAKSADGGFIPCFVDCPPGRYRALPLLKDKGTDYWYIPRLQFEGLDEYTVLPSSANITPSIRSERVEGWYEAYAGAALKKLNEPFYIVITVTNRAGTALKGEIKAVQERKLTSDFISYPISYLQAEGENMEEWSDEIGRINIDYSSEVEIKQELMNCVISIRRPEVYFCGPTVRWYFRAEGSSEWILMRCDYDHQFEKLKGITDYYKKKDDGWDIGLVGITIDNPAKNYADVRITD